jgi:hypothetical protein
MDLHPEIDLRVAPAWLVTAGWLWFWRTELDDGLYSISGQLLRSGRGTRARFIGQGPSFEIQRQITQPRLPRTNSNDEARSGCRGAQGS